MLRGTEHAREDFRIRRRVTTAGMEHRKMSHNITATKVAMTEIAAAVAVKISMEHLAENTATTVRDTRQQMISRDKSLCVDVCAGRNNRSIAVRVRKVIRVIAK